MGEKLTKNPMGYKKVLPLLIKMSLPIMLSMLIQSLYNIVDSYFVSQISEKALRATSLSYPIQIIIIGFFKIQSSIFSMAWIDRIIYF